MRISFPFLATDIRQLPMPGAYSNQGVEATIFNRRDLDGERWTTVWENVEFATRVYGPKNVSFHFPVNDSDYVADTFVRSRLVEARLRASDLGLAGMVVHSNRIRVFADWEGLDLRSERDKVLNALVDIASVGGQATWLALENMPIMDNYGKEIDPLFVFPDDFDVLQDTGLGIVWDFCHYSSSLANVREVLEGRQDRAYYPNLREADFQDFMRLVPRVRHWHFSAFLGVADPRTGTRCVEGVLPNQATLSEDIYVNAWRSMLQIPGDQLAVLEIIEDDYTRRLNAERMSAWCRAQEVRT